MNYRYIGNELETFKDAANWKRYLALATAPYIQGKVLEVGAGIGNTTSFLHNNKVTNWTCLEPDADLFQKLAARISKSETSINCAAKNKTIFSIEPDERFDTIIYIDVLEHIEKDQEEFTEASKHLNPQGHLLVLSPAFPFLYSAFDKAIGHYRRYDKTGLRRLSFPGMKLVQTKYLDSFGLFASLMNKILLKQSYPSQKQVNFWDQFLVPISKISDRFFFYSFGKSILGVWRKNN